mmetsp:Transcript_35434/g.45697  ORF Transcript_35434/g.45697 Transcript_35434/m.45697 type:complete len:230 (+) Transcript_35434:946-1635(+)
MDDIRSHCEHLGLVPLYHFTSYQVAPLIINSGFKMSTQGQGDGGVYFSTLGPASYGLGTNKYEENIIIDCFGKERLEEYQGQGKLEVCLVYGVDPLIVEQAPGGRDNALVVSKGIFQDFSLRNENGNYFLRPDRLFGAFRFKLTSQMSCISSSSSSSSSSSPSSSTTPIPTPTSKTSTTNVVDFTTTDDKTEIENNEIDQKMQFERMKDIEIQEFIKVSKMELQVPIVS